MSSRKGLICAAFIAISCSAMALISQADSFFSAGLKGAPSYDILNDSIIDLMRRNVI